MKAENKLLCFGVFKITAILMMCMFLLRFGGGAFAIVMMFAGVWWGLTGAYGKALSCYAFFPFLFIITPYVVPKSVIMANAMRFGPLLIGLVLLITASRRRGAHRLPLGGLFVYLFFAAISSIGGWSAKISFMKLINFILFLVGIWIGTQNLHQRPKDIMVARLFFLSLAFIVVYGSLLVLPFPAIAYPLDLNMAMILKESGMDAATTYFANKSDGMNLFAGITFHSQTLGPMLACLFAFVLSDMLFVERRISIFHLFLLMPMPIMLFMTRSRTAFFAFSVGASMVLLYAARKIQLEAVLRAKVRQLAAYAVVILVIGLIGAELSSNVVSRWLRKTDEVKTDQRNITTALTETRMGLYRQSLDEFRRNPIFGMGFQVNYESELLYGRKKGIVLSAPVEKGLLPMMVVGEGGIVGVIAFIAFLVSFYSSCAKRKYLVTSSLFTTYLATNFGEATFFSPGGGGGVEWMVCVLGGFVIDMLLVYRRQLESVFMVPMPIQQPQRSDVPSYGSR